jgi:hypothetical protein
MKKHVDEISAKSFDIVDYYDHITHNTWVHMGRNITLRLDYNKDKQHRLVDTTTSEEEDLNVGYLKKAGGKVIYHTAADERIEINKDDMQVHLAVVVVSPDEEEEVDEEKILKVGHYLWEYYETRRREDGERRVKLQDIRLEENKYDSTKYVVFIKYESKWKSMDDAYITYHSETTPDHSEGYQLKL